MPLPGSTFTKTKWLAFFAELTAKLTHHSVLVNIEGCRTLQRLLSTSVSVAALLQEGDLLQCLVDGFVGGVRSNTDSHSGGGGGGSGPSSLSASAALGEELSMAQLDTLGLCVSLMASLHADGDEYYSLLVLARAGVILEGLLQALQKRHRTFYGPVAAVVATLLTALPLGREPPPHLLRMAGMTGGGGGAPSRSSNGDNRDGYHNRDNANRFGSGSAAPPVSVALRRHIAELADLVRQHRPLLQDAADTLSTIVAATAGAQRFAALRLLDEAYRRLEKQRLRRRRAAAAASRGARPSGHHHTGGGDECSSLLADDDGDDDENDARSSAVTPTAGRQQKRHSPPGGAAAVGPSVNHRNRATYTDSGSDTTNDSGYTRGATAAATAVVGDATAFAEFNVTITGAAPSAPTARSGGGGNSNHNATTSSGASRGDATASGVAGASSGGTGEDVSDLVDGQPAEVGYTVPSALVAAVLAAMSQCRSHADFFAALGEVWCLTVADGPQVARLLSRESFQPLRRFLAVRPATRQDRALFSALLRWVGHLAASQTLRPETRDAVVDVAAAALIPMLWAEVAAADGGGGGGGSPAGMHSSPHRLDRTGTGAAGSASHSLPALSEAPSVRVPLLAFLLRLAPACTGAQMLCWLGGDRGEGGGKMRRRDNNSPDERPYGTSRGGMIDIVQAVVAAVANTKSALIDTPTTVDGALSDEVYLESALRTARSDDFATAVLGCKFAAALLSEYGPSFKTRRQQQQQGLDGATAAAVARLASDLAPTLLRIAINNPTVSSAQENTTGSALYHGPSFSAASSYGSSSSSSSSPAVAVLRSSRYATLGECAAVALDTCLAFNTSSNTTINNGPSGGGGVSLSALLPSLPALSRSTRQSIHGPLRACVYRALTHLCTSLDDLEAVRQTMPSVVSAAVTAVLTYSAARSPQWEAAAAAQWLCTVVRIVGRASLSGSSSDRNDDGTTTAALLLQQQHQFDLTTTALPLRLLEIAASAPLSFATTALLELCVALDEQQQSMAVAWDGDNGSASSPPMTSVLCPYGPRSVTVCWAALMRTTTTANESLARLDRLSIWAPKTPPPTGASAPEGATPSSSTHHGISTAAATLSTTSSDVASAASPLPLSAVTTTDALARAAAAADNIAVQYAFTANVLRGLTVMLARFPEHRSSLAPAAVYGLMAASLAVPSPARVLQLLSMRFSAAAVRIGGGSSNDNGHGSSSGHPTLTRAHGELVQWTCELAPVWFQSPPPAPPPPSPPSVSSLFPAVPALVYSAAARVMADASVSQRTRCHVSLLISSILIVPSPPPSTLRGCGDSGEEGEDSVDGSCCIPLRTSMRDHAAPLFAASLRLKRLTCVSGMQCRLLSCFAGAVAAAVGCGWFADRVADLEKLAALLVSSGGALDDRDTECFSVTLSLVVSVVGSNSSSSSRTASSSSGSHNSDGEALLPRKLRQSLCASLAEALRFERTRFAATRALQALAGSGEGRRCLLHEITASGEPLARSCFGRLLGLTLGIPSFWCGNAKSNSSNNHATRSVMGGRPRSSSPQQSTGVGVGYGALAAGTASPRTAAPVMSAAAREVLGEATVRLGYEVITAVCGRGEGHSFVTALLRNRGVEVVAQRILDCDRRHRNNNPGDASLLPNATTAADPMQLLRLVAALSLDPNGQKAIFHHQQLLTIVIEAASDATRAGSVALLVLRNLCFSNTSGGGAGLKTLLCQDTRVMLTLKAALMGLPTVEPLVVDTAPVVAPRASPVSAANSPRTPRQCSRAGGASPSFLTTTTATTATVSLREEVAQSDCAAVTDWGSHFARRYAAREHHQRRRSVSPGASPAPPSSLAAVAGRTSRFASSPPLITSDMARAAAGAEVGPRTPTTATGRGRATTPPPLREVSRRQELALSALWALMFDHQKGKMYVRSVLLLDPAVDIGTLFAGRPQQQQQRSFHRNGSNENGYLWVSAMAGFSDSGEDDDGDTSRGGRQVRHAVDETRQFEDDDDDVDGKSYPHGDTGRLDGDHHNQQRYFTPTASTGGTGAPAEDRAARIAEAVSNIQFLGKGCL